MERRTRQVHRLLGHPLFGVVYDQGIRELDTEGLAPVLGVLVEFLNELDTTSELKVRGEGRLLD